jgi:predicted nucleic acid-binding protein
VILADTNVLVDIRERDAAWATWSFDAVAEARLSGEVCVSAITIGELAARAGSLAEVMMLVDNLGIGVRPLGPDAAFRAGTAHKAYRAAGGRKEKLLADFLIGGEAVVASVALITRDTRHYRRYFPDLPLITPETDHG